MILILIMAILLIALVSVVAQSFVSLYVSANHVEQNQHEQRLGRLWEQAILSQLVKAGPNGEYIAPLGADLLGAGNVVIGHTLPDFIKAPKLNSIGIPVRYCPLGHEDIPSVGAGALTSISLTASMSYSAETLSVNGYPYVYTGSNVPGLIRHSNDVVGFVISPYTASESISCAGIQYEQETGRYFIPDIDAQVISILAPHVFTP
jgi:hypothetical protein